MNVNIQNKLIKKIKEINDPEILQEIYSWLDDESQLDIYVTSKAQKLEIKEAKKQIKSGKGLNEEEANNEVDKWLRGVG